MALPQSIPSLLSPDGTAITAPVAENNQRQKFIYITAILISDTLEIDGVSLTSPGPVSLSSPIKCRSFTPNSAGQVAYYII